MHDTRESEAWAGGQARSSTSTPESRSSPGPRRARLLIAEDDRSFRTLLRHVFLRWGYDVVTVDDGVELLDRLGQALASGSTEQAFDAVVSDIRMPGWSGLDVLATLGQEAHAPPVVLITAFGDENLHQRAERAGAAAVFDKPFDLDALQDLIARLVAG